MDDEISEFAGKVAKALGSGDIEQLEIVHPTLLKEEMVVREHVLGLRMDKLYREYGEICRNRKFRTITGSLMAVIAVTEHGSALAYRKKMISQGEISAVSELKLFDVILTSPLHKHTKSPLLWSHRRWILTNYAELLDVDHEFSVVSKAGQRHPKNYYAWAHLRTIVGHSEKNRQEIAHKTWQMCRENLSDTSLWSFLGWAAATDYVEESKRMNQQWGPHEAITAYIRMFESVN